MHVVNSVLDLIGNTPLLRLSKTLRFVDVNLFAKLEMFNPMSSVKDRIALAMIEEAEQQGLIQPDLIDDVIVVSDEEAMDYARLLLKTEEVFGGISSGASYYGAMKVAMRSEFSGKNVVTSSVPHVNAQLAGGTLIQSGGGTLIQSVTHERRELNFGESS